MGPLSLGTNDFITHYSDFRAKQIILHISFWQVWFFFLLYILVESFILMNSQDSTERTANFRYALVISWTKICLVCFPLDTAKLIGDLVSQYWILVYKVYKGQCHQKYNTWKYIIWIWITVPFSVALLLIVKRNNHHFYITLTLLLIEN